MRQFGGLVVVLCGLMLALTAPDTVSAQAGSGHGEGGCDSDPLIESCGGGGQGGSEQGNGFGGGITFDVDGGLISGHGGHGAGGSDRGGGGGHGGCLIVFGEPDCGGSGGSR
jgi:hypothetical protein